MKTYDRDYAVVYAALWAFGSETLGLKGAESVYRTVNRLVIESVPIVNLDESNLVIADLGCGVGRTVRDLAISFPQAKVYGFDNSADMVDIACSLLKGGNPIDVDLDDRGFPQVQLRSINLPNVSFHVVGEERCNHLELLKGVCNVVVSLNTIERVLDVEKYVSTAISLLAKGGVLVLTSSLNWQAANSWRKFRSFKALQQYVASIGDLNIEYTTEKLSYFEVIDSIGSGEIYNVWAAILRK